MTIIILPILKFLLCYFKVVHMGLSPPKKSNNLFDLITSLPYSRVCNENNDI